MLQEREKPVVLIVDDTPDNITLFNEILKNEYQVKVATNGERALEIALNARPDIILLDVMMPVMDGYETCRRLKQDVQLSDIPILFLTARSNEEDEKKGFMVGAADYIIKPVSPAILTARIKTQLTLKRARDILADQNRFLDEEVQRRTRDISTVQEASIIALAALAEIRDNETGQHLQRVKLYIQLLAEELARREKYATLLTPDYIRVIAISSPLHDIGKVGIPDEVLLNPANLTAGEYEIMKRHPILGRDAIACAEKMLGASQTFLSCAREIAYTHHEKWDGTGYPQGLSGESIPLPARLMALADAYDTLTSRRVYKEAVFHEEAVSRIRKDSGTHFDPEIVEAFLAVKAQFQMIAEKNADSSASILMQMRDCAELTRRIK